MWRISHNLWNRHYLAIHEAHQKFGTHVRIAPNHVSILDPEAMNEIYGHGAGMIKDTWYDGVAGEFRNMNDVRVKSEHQAKRKMLAHVFAQRTIANLEPVVSDTIATLVTEMDRYAATGEMINMRRYVNYFTIDLFAHLLYGRSLGCLERGDDMVDAETRDGKVYKASFVKSIHSSTTVNTILGMEAGLLPLTRLLLSWHPYKKAGADYDNIISHNTKRRLKESGGKLEDIFSKLLVNNKGEKLNLSQGEILAECGVMMNGGSEPTTAALTNMVYLIYKHSQVLKKLRAEIDRVAIGGRIPGYDAVANLPYLRACIEESLRVRPASSMGLPRIVPKGGRTIAGKFVDEGVTVSVPTYSLLRDPGTFESPSEFNPDRWITGDKQKMFRAHLPFSTGPRACIGRNISYFQEILLVATLVHTFDLELPAKDFELETIERFNSNPGELFMRCRRRPM